MYFENETLFRSPDRADILVVPKHRDEEIKAKAGAIVFMKTIRLAPKQKKPASLH